MNAGFFSLLAFWIGGAALPGVFPGIQETTAVPLESSYTLSPLQPSAYTVGVVQPGVDTATVIQPGAGTTNPIQPGAYTSEEIP